MCIHILPLKTSLPQEETQRQQLFEAEIGSSQERIQAVVGEGNQLVQEGRCGKREAEVMERVNLVSRISQMGHIFHVHPWSYHSNTKFYH